MFSIKKLVVIIFIMFTCGILFVLSQKNDNMYPSKNQSKNGSQISGQIVNENNEPVSNVKVYSLPTDATFVGRLFTTYTDKNGKFKLNNVKGNKIAVYTAKEEDGYADTGSGFHGTKEVPTFEFGSRQKIDNVTIVIGPKSPRLFGKFIDNQTGQSIKNAGITLCRIDNIKICYSTTISSSDGNFQVLTSSAPFTIKASASGYKDWEYNQIIDNSQSFLNSETNNAEVLTIPLEKVDIEK